MYLCQYQLFTKCNSKSAFCVSDSNLSTAFHVLQVTGDGGAVGGEGAAVGVRLDGGYLQVFFD
jgi:hypothetical protein